MGCWNGTCGLSDIAITDGTKVKFAFIMNKPNMPEASGFCYGSSYADLISFVMEGNYNDYGSVENIIEGPASELFLEYFRENLKNGKIEVHPDKYYDKEYFKEEEIDYSKFCIEGLIKAVERDRVHYTDMMWNPEIGNRSKQKVNIGFMIFNDTILQNVTEAYYNSAEWGTLSLENTVKDCTWAVEDMFINSENDLTEEQIEIALEEAKEKGDEEAEKRALRQYKKLIMSSKDWDSDDIRKTGDWSNVVRQFKGQEGSRMQAFKSFHKYLSNSIINIKENKEEIIQMLVQTLSLINSMNSLRKPWRATTGKGSQSFDEEVYIALADSIKQVCFESREDLTGYKLQCTQDWVNSSSRVHFKTDEIYEVTSTDYNKDLICIKTSDEQTTITYSEFLRYFEY